MSVGNQTGTFWPSALQERLLVVALEDQPGAAVEAWQEVRPRLSLDELERGSFELLPLIYRNLSLVGHDDAELPRLKGVYRRTWVKNNLLAERTKESSEVLAKAGIPALFIEGVTVASRFYRELGLRPTSSIDILVDDSDGTAALAQLARAGWTERRDSTTRPGDIRYLSDGNGNVCVLRTRLAIDCIGPMAREKPNAPFWETDDRHSLRGVEVPVPPSTETLFAVCISNARAGSPPNVQWIADAKMVLEAEIDWQRLLALAVESGQVLRLRDALGYLAALPGSKPPQEIRDRLATTKVTSRERLSYLCTAGSIRGVGAMPSLVAEHLGATAHRSSLGTITTFPGFLRDRWNLARSWQVPIAAGRRAVRLLGPRRGAA